MDQKTEICCYMKCHTGLNIDSKQIFNELCGIYGPQTISMCTVFRWVKAFKALKLGNFLLQMITVLEGLKPVTKANIAAVVKQDARLSVKDIASCTGISEGSVHNSEKALDLRKVCARWVLHLLTEEQKTPRLKCARELLKTYKGCNSRVISNLLTGDETWVHMQRKLKDKKRPCIAKRTVSSKNMLYAICCTQFSLIQVGQSVKCLVHLVIQSPARFYKNSVLKRVKEFYNKKQPSKGWSGAHL